MPGGGDGLFLLRDVPASGTVVAFYNGLRMKDDGDEDEAWDVCDYRVFVDLESEERIDMPSEYRGWSRYRTTSGHKVNHSFVAANCEFGTFFHPRFGRVPCIKTMKPALKKGTELLCYYHYALSDCPQWYSDLWDKMGE